MKEIQRAAQINLGSLKMSYLILRSPKAGWPELPDRPLLCTYSFLLSNPIQAEAYHLCGTGR